MRKRFSQIANMLRKGLATIDIKVYAICVLIAAFIWLLMTLSDNYNEEIEFPVVYTNFPPGMILVSKPTKFITAQVESQGFELATATLSNQKAVHIDLSKIRLKKSAYGRYVASIPTSAFRFNIINQLNVDNVGKEFKPDSIYFIFDSLVTKKLKVKLNSRIEYVKGFAQYGKEKIIPDYVLAKGPALLLDKLKYIYTDSVILKDVSSDINKEVGLVAIDDMVEIDRAKVKVVIKTEKYSEFSISVPVHIVSNVPNLKVKTFPSYVKITCLMALTDYNLLTDTSFIVSARIDSLDLLNEDRVILQLAKKPIKAKSVRLSDESVEYVIIN